MVSVLSGPQLNQQWPQATSHLSVRSRPTRKREGERGMAYCSFSRVSRMSLLAWWKPSSTAFLCRSRWFLSSLNSWLW